MLEDRGMESSNNASSPNPPNRLQQKSFELFSPVANSTPSMMQQPKHIASFIIKTAIIATIVVFSQTIKYFLTPSERGFVCGDTSLLYPYRDSTVPYLPMIFVASALILILVICTEFVYHSMEDSESYLLSDYVIRPPVVRCVYLFLMCLFGFGVQSFVVYLLKFSLGQLRPNFISVCRPAPCTIGVYQNAYTCTNPSLPEYVITDSHLSFPSGHTSTIFYYAIFAIIYIHCRLARHQRQWMLVFMCVHWLLFSMAAMVGISRILDHKHHASDVLFGAVLGSSVAASVMFYNKDQLISDNTEKTNDARTHKDES